MPPSQRAISTTENLSIITLESEAETDRSRPRIEWADSFDQSRERRKHPKPEIAEQDLVPAPPLQLRQHPVHQRDADRPFAHGGGHALHVSGADIAHGEHSRQTCLEHLRHALKRPMVVVEDGIEISPGEDEALVLEGPASF